MASALETAVPPSTDVGPPDLGIVSETGHEGTREAGSARLPISKEGQGRRRLQQRPGRRRLWWKNVKLPEDQGSMRRAEPGLPLASF